ncbi:MAG TPA: hypothetical protein VJ376_00410, partial [Pseudomonadota bacterium]|nr:hypothetical protein [Pseudomonadota bacterium]
RGAKPLKSDGTFDFVASAGAPWNATKIAGSRNTALIAAQPRCLVPEHRPYAAWNFGFVLQNTRISCKKSYQLKR